MVSSDLRGEPLRIGLLLLAALLQLFPSGNCRCVVQSAPIAKPTENCETEAKKCPCCSCESESKVAVESKPSNRPSQSCPCRLSEFVSLPPTKIELPNDAEFGIVYGSTPLLTSAHLERQDSPIPTGLRSLPWLTKEEKLYSHHVLRC